MDVQYFIDKFEKIPEDRWCTGLFTKGDNHCAYGHCGVMQPLQETVESKRLSYLFRFSGIVTDINDGRDKRYPQPTPKQRILAALRDVKNKEV